MRPGADRVWPRVSDYVAEAMGLHFPQKRWPDLERGFARAAAELGFESALACGEWLLSAVPTKGQFQALVDQLTIGETYFFREPKTFAALSTTVLPELIRARRAGRKRLRFWSVACCTGEEPYSLAILLHQVLPDLAEWDVNILATDLNVRFLRKAAEGEYGTWSFRDSPPEIRRRYFKQSGDRRFTILPEIKRLVTFQSLNLAQDAYPSPLNGTDALDVIFCRNVLIYFSSDLVRKVIERLHRSLVPGGWLAVGPSEVSQELFPLFVSQSFPGAILYQKDDARNARDRARQQGVQWDLPPPVASEVSAPFVWNPPPPLAALGEDPAEVFAKEITSLQSAAALYEQGHYAEVEKILLADLGEGPVSPESAALLTRALANQGKLPEALVWCDRWIAADKVDPAAHYLHAIVLIEREALDQAQAALQRAVYLLPEFVLAHFALGNLARRLGRKDAASRHFANTLRLLGGRPPDEPLPESEGLTVGRLIEMIGSMTGSGDSK